MTIQQQKRSLYAPRVSTCHSSECPICRRIFLVIAGLWMAIGLTISTPVYATPNGEDTETIEYLIDYVSQSDMIFVRNFSKHKPNSAAKHIRKKYDYFLDDISSPEEFIELCASKSLVTGSEYNVVDPAGKKIKSRDWLLGALKDYRATQKQASNQ